MWEKGVELLVRRLVDPAQHVGEVVFQVHAVGLTTGSGAVEDGLLLTGFLVVEEHVVLAAQGDGPQRVCGGIVPRLGLCRVV